MEELGPVTELGQIVRERASSGQKSNDRPALKKNTLTGLLTYGLPTRRTGKARAFYRYGANTIGMILS